MTQQGIRDAIETHATKTDALLADAEKAATAGTNPEASDAIAKTVESVRAALEKFIESIMRTLKALFSSTRGSHP
jgi:hypothetical protein